MDHLTTKALIILFVLLLLSWFPAARAILLGVISNEVTDLINSPKNTANTPTVTTLTDENNNTTTPSLAPPQTSYYRQGSSQNYNYVPTQQPQTYTYVPVPSMQRYYGWQPARPLFYRGAHFGGHGGRR